MGVLQSFTGDRKSWIDGVEVTPESKEELVARNVRNRAKQIVIKAIEEIEHLWSGRKELSERDRIIAILSKSLSEINEE